MFYEKIIGSTFFLPEKNGKIVKLPRKEHKCIMSYLSFGAGDAGEGPFRWHRHAVLFRKKR